jgi:hypothetical protein
MRRCTIFTFFAVILFSGCAHWAFVPYEQVGQENRVLVELISGNRIEGTVTKCDPVQWIVKTKTGPVTVSKSTIRSVRRQPVVQDEFGRGISEEEIAGRRTSKNAWIYGLGGGALSFGFSFFTSSLAAQSSDNGGGPLAAGTAIGTAAGTALFIHAGRHKDRNEAILKIQEERRRLEPGRTAPDTSDTGLLRRLDQERRKREEFLKQREQLLRELEESRNQP